MLSRIKRRNKTERPTVERDTSLVQPSDFTESIPSSASSTPLTEATPAPAASVESTPVQSAAAGATAIEAELAEMPQVGARRNIRLEVELERRLLSFCQENDVTVETFLEACFVEVEQNARTRAELVEEAQRRLKQRKHAGKLRRVLSQLRK